MLPDKFTISFSPLLKIPEFVVTGCRRGEQADMTGQCFCKCNGFKVIKPGYVIEFFQPGIPADFIADPFARFTNKDDVPDMRAG